MIISSHKFGAFFFLGILSAKYLDPNSRKSHSPKAIHESQHDSFLHTLQEVVVVTKP